MTNVQVKLTSVQVAEIIIALRYRGSKNNNYLADFLNEIKPVDPADDGPEVRIIKHSRSPERQS